MRHLWSLLAGVVAAPLAWLCLSTGQYQSTQTVAKWNEEQLFDTAELIGPAAFVLAAGIVLGLVGTLRWSPAGPLVAGLLLVIPTIFMFIDPFRTLDAFSLDQPRRLFEQDYQPWLPVQNGTLLVLGALLLMAVFSAQRWRRWPASAAAQPATAEPATPTGTGSASDQPASMSDEEILAAAAALEEEERATTEQPDADAESPAEPANEPDPASEPEPATASTPDPEQGTEPEPAEADADQVSARSGTSTK